MRAVRGKCGWLLKVQNARWKNHKLKHQKISSGESRAAYRGMRAERLRAIERNVARIRTTIAALKTARDTSATRNMRMIVVASMAARVTAERGARYERGAARKDHRVALNDAARDRAADAVAAPLQVPFFRAANERLLAEIEARLTGHVFPPEEHILWKVRDWRPCHTSLDFAAAASTLLVGSLPAHTRTHVRRWRPSTTQRNPPP